MESWKGGRTTGELRAERDNVMSRGLAEGRTKQKRDKTVGSPCHVLSLNERARTLQPDCGEVGDAGVTRNVADCSITEDGPIWEI